MRDRHRARKTQANLSLPFQAMFVKNVSTSQGKYTLYAVVIWTIIGITSHKPIIFLIQHFNPPAPLFSVKLALQSDLDKVTGIEELRSEFRRKGIFLSQSSTSVKKKDNTWAITDANNKKTYIVRKAEKLDIYATTPTGDVANLASAISFGLCAVLLIVSLLKMQSIISAIEGRRLTAFNRHLKNRKKSNNSDD